MGLFYVGVGCGSGRTPYIGAAKVRGVRVTELTARDREEPINRGA